MKRLLLAGVLVLSLLVFSAALAAAQDGGEDPAGDGTEIVMTGYTSTDFRWAGLVPEGWMAAQQPGIYVRGESPTDPTALIQQFAPGVAAEEILTSLAGSLQLEALPESDETLAANDLAWTLYLVEAEVPQFGAMVVDIALAEGAQGMYIIILQTTADDHDALQAPVFRAAVEAFQARAWSWGPNDNSAGADVVEVQILQANVLDSVPHDTDAYTQGLLLYEGSLYESTGAESMDSTLREVDPATGDVIRSITLDEAYYGEGLARVDDRLVQLTWRENVAFVYDIETFEVVEEFEYEGEGWGLCYDGEFLYRSDGTPVITLHDPETFEVVAEGLVALNGQPVEQLNELECVGEYIYANVWQTDVIVQIDKFNGQVINVIFAENLLTEEETAALTSSQAVLNGIAYLPESETFLITGKYWPRMFEVEFVEPPSEDASTGDAGE